MKRGRVPSTKFGESRTRRQHVQRPMTVTHRQRPTSEIQRWLDHYAQVSLEAQWRANDLGRGRGIIHQVNV